MKKIKVGAVTYLNSKPLIYGMQQEDFLKDHELILEYPARLAEMLKKGEVDVALVPVALLAELPHYHIVSDYCIASDHEVASVCLFSEQPLSEIKSVYLDYQSKTSVALLKVLFKQHWKQEVEFLSAANESYIDNIQDDIAGLIIGDRALQFRDRFTYRYDLATAWREMTGLPFVFAVWVSLHVFSQNLIDAFNSAQAKGTYDLDLVVKERKQVFPFFNISNYYKNHISYFLDEQKRKGMQNFLDLIHENKLFLDGQFINIVT